MVTAQDETELALAPPEAPRQGLPAGLKLNVPGGGATRTRSRIVDATGIDGGGVLAGTDRTQEAARLRALHARQSLAEQAQPVPVPVALRSLLSPPD